LFTCWFENELFSFWLKTVNFYSTWLNITSVANKVPANEQVLPMVGNFIFVRSEPLLGFLIKLNI